MSNYCAYVLKSTGAFRFYELSNNMCRKDSQSSLNITEFLMKQVSLLWYEIEKVNKLTYQASDQR